MIRTVLLAAALALPTLASAQAIKCHDPATGKTLYTDQPCKGGELVVPPRSAAEQQQDAEAATLARERALRRDELALERERAQLQAAQAAQAAEQARAPRPAAESDGCRKARAEASFRAASFAASEQEIRTARANAALACGQPPPAEIVVVQPPLQPVRPRPPHRYDEPRRPPPGAGGGFGQPRPRVPAPPEYAPGTEPSPARVVPPGAR